MPVKSSTALPLVLFFFFNDTATTEIYTLSLHDALPISDVVAIVECDRSHLLQTQHAFDVARHRIQRLLLIGVRIALAQFERFGESHSVRNISVQRIVRSEEHTSELQSRSDLVCRLLLEK